MGGHGAVEHLDTGFIHRQRLRQQRRITQAVFEVGGAGGGQRDVDRQKQLSAGKELTLIKTLGGAREQAIHAG